MELDDQQVTGQHLSSFNWLTEFHISVGGVAFIPQPMNASQGQLRSRPCVPFQMITARRAFRTSPFSAWVSAAGNASAQVSGSVLASHLSSLKKNRP